MKNIVYDLPDGKITITSDGKIIEGEVNIEGGVN